MAACKHTFWQPVGHAVDWTTDVVWADYCCRDCGARRVRALKRTAVPDVVGAQWE